MTVFLPPKPVLTLPLPFPPYSQKFLLPSLQPPSETDLQASQAALEAKYDEAASLLQTLQDSTDAIASSLDEQKVQVEKDLEEVRKAVEEMREGERKRDEWARKVESQVEDMVKSLPGVRSVFPASLSLPPSTSISTDLSHHALLIAPRQANLLSNVFPCRPSNRTQVSQVSPHRSPSHSWSFPRRLLHLHPVRRVYRYTVGEPRLRNQASRPAGVADEGRRFLPCSYSGRCRRLFFLDVVVQRRRLQRSWIVVVVVGGEGRPER
jgi:hypothetical protein